MEQHSRMAEPEPYGKKIDYDPLWRGPMNKERHPTDDLLLKCLVAYCIIWMGIATYAYSNGNPKFPLNFDNIREHRMRQVSYMGRSSYESSYSEISYSKSSSNTSGIKSIIIQFTTVSIILCATFLMLLRWFVKFIVYTFIIAVFTIMFCITCYAATLPTRDIGVDFLPFIFSALIFVTFLILFIIHRKKIDISCEVIREASKCVMFFPTALVFPILPFIMFLVVVIFAVIVHFSLVSISSQYIETPNHISFFYLYNIFGFWWLGGFVLSFSQMVLSGTFATWYWTLNKVQVPNYALLRFADTTVKHHLGTLAFGSLIVAICRLIKIILKTIKKNLQGRCSPFACCCFGWYNYFFENIEKYVTYINKNAYIMCAIHGTGFYESAKNAFNLLMRNIVKVLIINKMTDVILFFGQLFTVFLSILSAAWYMDVFYSDRMVPLLFPIGIIALIISIFFFMVLRTAIDTIFLCVLEDYERNDGSHERPYYMSYELKKLFLEQ